MLTSLSSYSVNSTITCAAMKHITAAFLTLSFWSTWLLFSISVMEWDVWLLCNTKSVLDATPRLSNHYISINTGCLPQRQATTGWVHGLSGVHQLITARQCFLVQVRCSVESRPAGCRTQQGGRNQLTPQLKERKHRKMRGRHRYLVWFIGLHPPVYSHL